MQLLCSPETRRVPASVHLDVTKKDDNAATFLCLFVIASSVQLHQSRTVIPCVNQSRGYRKMCSFSTLYTPYK